MHRSWKTCVLKSKKIIFIIPKFIITINYKIRMKLKTQTQDTKAFMM